MFNQSVFCCLIACAMSIQAHAIGQDTISPVSGLGLDVNATLGGAVANSGNFSLFGDVGTVGQSNVPSAVDHTSYGFATATNGALSILGPPAIDSSHTLGWSLNLPDADSLAPLVNDTSFDRSYMYQHAGGVFTGRHLGAPNSSGTCDAEIRFNLINKAGVDLCFPDLQRNGDFSDDSSCAHHAYVVTRSGDSEFSTRGGPKFNHPAFFGPIKTDYGVYQPGFVDWTASPNAVVPVGSFADPGCVQTKAKLIRYAAEVNARKIPYIAHRQNSNTFAISAVEEALGISVDRDAIPVAAPGIGARLGVSVPHVNSPLSSPITTPEPVGSNPYGLPRL